MKLESIESPLEIPLSQIEDNTFHELSGKELSSSSFEIADSKEGIHEDLGKFLEMSNVSFETPEVLTDLEMTENIADYLETVEEFKFENWNKLSLEQKAEVLNRVEQNIAAIEHRPALKVELEQMEPRHLGYQSASENKIVLNTLYVSSNDPQMHREVLDTIIHEGRHAYQHYNVDVKSIHESGAEVATWRENFYDPQYQYYQSTGQKIIIPYNDGSVHDVDFRLYYYQPVEIDARNFAEDVMSRLEEKGIVSSNA